MDEARLVRQLKKGSEEAFQKLFNEYKDRIFSVVYRILADASLCEDVVQDAFMKALRHIDSFNFKSAFYTWLYRIAVNAAVDAKKKFRTQGVVSLYRQDGSAMEFISPGEGPDTAPQRREMAGLLHEALDQLSDKHRTILILREFQGLSYTEIAEVLDCSKGTVESRLFRARNRLKEKMERYL